MKKILVLVFSVGILLLSACTAQASMPEASSASDRAGATESTLPRQEEPISSSAGNEAAESTPTESTMQPTQPAEPQPDATAEQQKQSLLKPHSPPNRQPSHRVRYLIPFIHRQTLSVSSRRSEPMRKAMRHRASALSGRTAWRFPRMSDTSGRRISGMKVWTVQSGVCSTMWIRSSKLPPIRPMV